MSLVSVGDVEQHHGLGPARKRWSVRKARAIMIALLCLSILLLVGCLHANRPRVPDSLSNSKDTKYSAQDFKKDYDTYKQQVTAGNNDRATALRDQMINRIEVDIEQDYREFEASFSQSRAGIQTTGDVVELGISAATGIVSGTDIKDLLSASLTAFKGTRLSVEKNYFREKTTEALVSQMQAYRDTVRNRVTQKTTELDARKYPFEEAWRDLVEFFYAGTLQAALQQLANQAGQSATEAKATSQRIDINRATSAEQEKAAIRIRAKYAELYNNAINETDQQKRDAALKTAKDALIALGQGNRINPDSTPDQIFEMLRQQMRHALDHPEEIQPMDKILTPQRQ